MSIKKIKKLQKKIVGRNFKRAARKGMEKIKKQNPSMPADNQNNDSHTN